MSEGVPYLGSKINLISKSEIRYEGILYTIDTNESTVALAKVRSFGTEDRPTDRPVAARDEVYEYIIFRGKDIKDIRVCEPPKPQPTLTGGLPNDPAIVQHSAPIAMPGYSDFGRQPGFGPVGAMSYYPSAPGASTQSFVSQTSGSSRSNTPTSTRKSPTMDQGVQVSGTAYTPKGEKRDMKQRTSSGPNQNQQKSSMPVNQQQREQRQSMPGGTQNKQVGPRQQQGNVRRGRGGPRGGRGGFTKPKEPQLKFEGEYDFEQANAEFKEMESQFAKTKIADGVQNGEVEPAKDEVTTSSSTATTVTTTTVSPATTTDESTTTTTTTAEIVGTELPATVVAEEELPVPFYDKAKSFFDNISCEALERSKGKLYRTDWRQERKLNAETFGVTNSYMRRGGYRGRGGFRYRGYRGSRPRGGFGGNRGGGGGSGNPGNLPSNRENDSRGSNLQNRKPSSPGWETAKA